MSVDTWAARMQLPPAAEARQSFAREGFILVPSFWPTDVHNPAAALAANVVKRCGVKIHRTSGDEVLDYEVVTGDLVRSEAAPLFNVYKSRQLLSWIRGVTEIPTIKSSPHLRSAININCLSRSGQGYPWHKDAVPYTALVFLTTLAASAGGEFLIRTAQQDLVTIRPTSGALVLMDGSLCAHSVARLRENVTRLSIPMVFPVTAVDRPAGLDDYLYESAHRADTTSST